VSSLDGVVWGNHDTHVKAINHQETSIRPPKQPSHRVVPLNHSPRNALVCAGAVGHVARRCVATNVEHIGICGVDRGVGWVGGWGR